MFAKIGKTTVGLALILAGMSAATAQDEPAFGGETDVSYAETLWNRLTEVGLAGDGAIQTKPYEGTEPHGAVLETLWEEIEVDGQQGLMIVKRNYAPAGVTIDEVANDPAANLDSVTVMFHREDGYAPESGNWFWAKYLPDGSLDETPEGTSLAGQVEGCISCHSEADGEDFVYTINMNME